MAQKKTDPNKENDELARRGMAHLHAVKKRAAAKKARMQDPAVRQAVLDFIFDRTGTVENPLADLNE